MTIAEILLALLSGWLIGFVLGLVGGGGSILAVPLLVYLVGIGSAHEAIGTAAVAVAVNAAIGLAGHARAGTVKWRCAAVFAAAGMLGAGIGAEIGKLVDGNRLLMLFGLLMIGVGLSMLRTRRKAPAPDVRLSRETAVALLPRLVPIGFGVGLAAGFFGIGGGFLIVPGLIAATAMPLGLAVGTSLVVVTALGLTTATSYALSGYVDWPLAAILVVGGIAGAAIGLVFGRRPVARKGLLERIFASIVILVGIYVAIRGA
ncbi:MAG: sulfite exporter TauE/SafE family protein [Sphingomonas sp.]